MIEFRESPRNRIEDAALRRKVTRLLRPPESDLAPVQEAIRQGFEENFDSESAGGVPWAPLSPATVAQRILMGYGGAHPILQRSGHYHDTFTQAGNADHVSLITYNAGLTKMEEGSGDPLAAFIEPGTSKMPAREVLVLSSSALGDVGDALVEMASGILNA